MRDRSNALPEDSLPSWVFYTEECPVCGETIDEGYNYSEYDISVCDPDDCDMISQFDPDDCGEEE